ncbi:MAG: outer membrane lipoprotein carrier protein LolA [Opitutaceae bacterium]|nr:outer membrane lipoprotein carrier protein LolA [Opitutaceae bacterium]
MGLAFTVLAAVVAQAAAAPPLIAPQFRLEADPPAWRELAARFARRTDTTASFEERRYFPFRKEPVVLVGDVRVSPVHGLSLHYTSPDERTMILDDHGLLVREASGQAAPLDPRAAAAVGPLRSILRFDFAELAAGYELYGRRAGETWSLGLVPRDATLRRALGDIFVEGEADTVRRIELRRSAKQHIDIVMAAPQPAASFTPEERRRFFR